MFVSVVNWYAEPVPEEAPMKAMSEFSSEIRLTAADTVSVFVGSAKLVSETDSVVPSYVNTTDAPPDVVLTIDAPEFVRLTQAFASVFLFV